MAVCVSFSSFLSFFFFYNTAVLAYASVRYSVRLISATDHSQSSIASNVSMEREILASASI